MKKSKFNSTETKKPMIILIGGSSGAGKGLMAEKINQKLGKDLALLQTDDFCKKETTENVTGSNFDIFDKFNWPENLEKDILINSLKSLLEGKDIVIQAAFPKSPAEKEVSIRASRIVIAEGTHALQNEEIRNLADLKIYFDSDDDIKLIRRIRRSPYYKETAGSGPIDGRGVDLSMGDPRNYGKSIVEAFDIWIDCHKSSEKKHIVSTKKYADLSFYNNTWEELEKSVKKVVNFINLYFEDKEEFKNQLELVQIKTKELNANENKVRELEKRVLELTKKNKELVNEKQEEEKRNLQDIISQLEAENSKLKEKFDLSRMQVIREELDKMVMVIKGGIDGNKGGKELLDTLLEAQVDAVKFDSVFAKKQLMEMKSKILSTSKFWKSKLNEEDLEKICQKQKELTQLEVKMEKTITEMEELESHSHTVVSSKSSSSFKDESQQNQAQIQIPPK